MRSFIYILFIGRYYAEAIANYLDPNKEIISFVLNRKYCLETKNGLYIKDLRIIGNRDLKNVVIVDNLAHSFSFQIENGVNHK
jgi:CTD small phosphatase-like protein 2